MTRYADPHRCPDCCRRLAPEVLVCPHCGLDLSGPLGAELFSVLSRADAILVELRARAAVPAGAPATPVVTVPPPTSAAPTAPPSPRPPAGPLARPLARPLAGPLAGHGRIRPSSVSRLLLALGALCLLVAALVFLAVTWSVLGVAGRTAVLLTGTAATAGVTWWLAHRGLRGATEALTTVTFGLAVLDLAGGRAAGWLGTPSAAAFTLLVGVVLVATGCATAPLLRRTPSGAGLAAEVVAVVGVLLAAVGIVELEVGGSELRLVVATLWAAGVGVVAGRRLSTVRDGGTVIAVLTWAALVVTGVSRLDPAPTLGSVWGAMEGWPLLVAGGLAAVVALLRPLPLRWRVAALAAALVPLTLAATVPAFDESATVLAATGVAVLALSTAYLTLVPRPWSASALSVAAPTALLAGVAVLALLGEAGDRYLDAAEPVGAGRAQDRLPGLFATDLPEPWLLPLLSLALAATGWALTRTAQWARPAARQPVSAQPVSAQPVSAQPVSAQPVSWRAVLLTLGPLAAGVVAIATLLLHPVPVWSVLAGLLALAAAATLVAVRSDGPNGDAPAWTPPAGAPPSWAALAGAATVGIGLHATWLAVLGLGGVLVLAVLLHSGTRDSATAAAAGAAVSPLLAGFGWNVGDVAAVDGRWTALVVLLLLGLLAVGRPGLPLGLRSDPVLLGVELGAAVTALLVGATGVDAAAVDTALGEAGSGGSPATWAAVYLTVAGVAATALALLRPDRRPVGWLGGALLVLASWVRLAEVGVTAPEPYAVPGAVALLAAGLLRLRRSPETSTASTLVPGLALGLVPSLIWVWWEPVSWRALALGLVCLVLVLVGLRLRWAAPVVAGVIVGAALVLREAAPYVGTAVPRWALIGAAGVLLTALGVTWEERVRQAHGVAQRLRALR